MSHYATEVCKCPRRCSDIGNYRPYILNEEDLQDVLESQAFFCRKVDLPESDKLLDLIDLHRGERFDIDAAVEIL